MAKAFNACSMTACGSCSPLALTLQFVDRHSASPSPLRGAIGTGLPAIGPVAVAYCFRGLKVRLFALSRIRRIGSVRTATDSRPSTEGSGIGKPRVTVSGWLIGRRKSSVAGSPLVGCQRWPFFFRAERLAAAAHASALTVMTFKMPAEGFATMRGYH